MLHRKDQCESVCLRTLHHLPAYHPTTANSESWCHFLRQELCTVTTAGHDFYRTLCFMCNTHNLNLISNRFLMMTASQIHPDLQIHARIKLCKCYQLHRSTWELENKQTTTNYIPKQTESNTNKFDHVVVDASLITRKNKHLLNETMFLVPGNMESSLFCLIAWPEAA